MPVLNTYSAVLTHEPTGITELTKNNTDAQRVNQLYSRYPVTGTNESVVVTSHFTDRKHKLITRNQSGANTASDKPGAAFFKAISVTGGILNLLLGADSLSALTKVTEDHPYLTWLN
jgi:hypothetical protein